MPPEEPSILIEAAETPVADTDTGGGDINKDFLLKLSEGSLNLDKI